jgi:beta-galactosidase
LRYGRNELLAGPCRLELYRAPTDNDGLKLVGSRAGAVLGRWQAWGLDRLEHRPGRVEWQSTRRGAYVISEEEIVGAGGLRAAHRQRITVLASGDVLVTDALELPSAWDDVGRIGLSFEMPAAYHDVEWFGRGPGENEPDRNRGSMVARWAGQPDELPYLMPQDFGTRTDVRWLRLSGRAAALLIVPIEPAVCSFSATHHRTDDLALATDWLDLPRRDESVVHVDTARRGVGTASCGPDTLARYRIAPGRHVWTWRLRPHGVADDPGPLARESFRSGDVVLPT